MPLVCLDQLVSLWNSPAMPLIIKKETKERYKLGGRSAGPLLQPNWSSDLFAGPLHCHTLSLPLQVFCCYSDYKYSSSGGRPSTAQLHVLCSINFSSMSDHAQRVVTVSLAAILLSPHNPETLLPLVFPPRVLKSISLGLSPVAQKGSVVNIVPQITRS